MHDDDFDPVYLRQLLNTRVALFLNGIKTQSQTILGTLRRGDYWYVEGRAAEQGSLEDEWPVLSGDVIVPFGREEEN